MQENEDLGSGASSICVGLLLSSVLTLPILFERDQTRLRSGFSLSVLPDPTISQLLLWTNYQIRIGGSDFTADHWYGGYVGLSAVLLCLTGLGIGLRRGSRMPTVQWSAAAYAVQFGLALLRDEAERVEEAMGGVVALSVHLLDLRPRPTHL